MGDTVVANHSFLYTRMTILQWLALLTHNLFTREYQDTKASKLSMYEYFRIFSAFSFFLIYNGIFLDLLYIPYPVFSVKKRKVTCVNFSGPPYSAASVMLGSMARGKV